MIYVSPDLCCCNSRERRTSRELFWFYRWSRVTNLSSNIKLQRTMYNGHQLLHGMKFQSVSLPNGLIAHLYRPVGMLTCYPHFIPIGGLNGMAL